MGTSIYLDDNRSPPEGWKVARTADEAKTHLLTGRVENMSMDHDLDQPECPTCNFDCDMHTTGCEHGCSCHDQGKENGLDLLHWMKDYRAWPKHKPLVHSHNLDGALRMRAFIELHYPGV